MNKTKRVAWRKHRIKAKKREELEKQVASGTERIAALETTAASTKQDLEDTRRRLVAESTRADRAQAKWDADRQSLERAKDALAFALAQIEEAEGRSMS